MPPQKDNTLFPGQERGIIRILIKKGQEEGAVQLRLNLFDEEPPEKE
ncbi:hypothetical protein [Halobacillus halophilus]|nr:hypothetical protein [Halobacillus halophilus]MCA1010378.1 hypothetical protein [Halobacillus halophilus]